MSASEKKEKHPSYGMVGLSQVTANKKVLVGSSVVHNNYLTLTIKEAEKVYSLNREWWFGHKTICQIALSHAQLTELLFSTNRGDGIPCTIEYVQGDGTYRRPEPPFTSPFKEYSDDMITTLQETLAMAQTLAHDAEHLIENGLRTKKEKETLLSLLYKLAQNIESNLPYTVRCVDEKIEKTMAQAKAEIESFVELKLRMAGVKALENDIPSPKFIPKKK